ncbi:MAG TPA: TOBE domain-containing protein [Chitinophagaceae bacterium]|jgi:molybdopterin-binding protein|nr:TOBE domain-containing protein [Chitinophagaceae bacterium]
MNKIKGTITAIETDEGISLVTVEVSEHAFSAVVIDTPQTAGYLRMGGPVFLVFKETEMAIGKNLSGGLSLRNRFPGRIIAIEEGKVLTNITVDFEGMPLMSVITTPASKRLLLQVGDPVEGLVKATEMSLMKTDN